MAEDSQAVKTFKEVAMLYWRLSPMARQDTHLGRSLGETMYHVSHNSLPELTAQEVEDIDTFLQEREDAKENAILPLAHYSGAESYRLACKGLDEAVTAEQRTWDALSDEAKLRVERWADEHMARSQGI